MDASAEFRRCMAELDIDGVKRIWAHVQPNMPKPENDHAALSSLHVARTAAVSMPFSKRAYSHSWLSERGLPSMLPDALRPRAQRMYPVIVPGVGIAVRTLSEHRKPAAKEIQRAMEHAVLEAVEDGKLEDSTYVKVRMEEARWRTIKKLFG